MATKLIRLEDGTLVEVETIPEDAQRISNSFAQKVESSIDLIKPTLMHICKPFAETWKELNKDMNLDSAEIELSLNFDVEGNLYITKTKASANIKVKLTLK